MKIIFVFIFTFISFNVFASEISEDISKYRYFQTSDFKYGKHKSTYVVFIKYDDPCIFVRNVNMNEPERICEMEGSEFNLERDSNTIYLGRFKLSPSNFKFGIFSEKKEQLCEVDLINISAKCITASE